MLETVDISFHLCLDDYASDLTLESSVASLRQTFAETKQNLRGRKLWMISSTRQGGGVAEMLPTHVGILRELGVETEWLVMCSDAPEFFAFTKRLHNAIHGMADLSISDADRDIYRSVSKRCADDLLQRIGAHDIVLLHDPQPAQMGALVKRQTEATVVWRCHIGVDKHTEGSRTAWDFLRPWLVEYDHTVFSVREYIPSFVGDRCDVIPPSIDPLSHKNRELSIHKLTGILANSRLIRTDQPMLYDPIEDPARRLGLEGFVRADEPEDFGVLFRPLVLQVSRWDRYKGFAPLLRGFAELKHDAKHPTADPRHARRRQLVRLALVGPDPASIQDDPEGKEVLDELCSMWRELPEDLQRDIGLFVLPMSSRKHNALMVNALQRCSTVVVQNSLREGFGLTATEAMWKTNEVVVSNAAGLRTQVEDGVHGHVVQDPENPEEIANTLDCVLSKPTLRTTTGHNARRRVARSYLVLEELQHWLRLFGRLTAKSEAS